MSILLSVIIPTRNRLSVLKDLLESFNKHEKTDFEWEILIIDNMSNDGTYEFFNSEEKPYNFNLRYFKEKNLGLHYCRHRGAFEAKGEIIAYLDDDMLVAPNWLYGVNLIREKKAEMVIGRILPKWETVPPLWVDYFYINGRSDFLGLLDFGIKIKKANVVFGGNFFIKKEILLDLGGFGPDGFPKEFSIFRGNGEGKLWRRFKNNNYRNYYDPTATVLHIIDESRLTCNNFIKKVYNAEISKYIYSIREQAEVEEKRKASLYDKIKGRINYYFTNLEKNKVYNELSEEEKKFIDKIFFDGKEKAEKVIQEFYKKQEIQKWLLKKDYLNFDFDYLIELVEKK